MTRIGETAPLRFAVPFWPMVRTILLAVLLPLLAGMAVRARMHRISRIGQDWAPAVAVLCIVAIIGYAVAANQQKMLSAGAEIFLLVVLVNALGYGAGWWLARWYRFDDSFRLALMIEVGMQNAGLGVALALAHFPPETALPGALFAAWCVLTAAVASMVLRGNAAREAPGKGGIRIP